MKKSNSKVAVYERMVQNVLLKEAMLKIGNGKEQKKYFIPDSQAQVYAKDPNAVDIDSLIAPAGQNFDPKLDPKNYVLSVIGSFNNDTVKAMAKDVYLQNAQEINDYFGKQAGKLDPKFEGVQTLWPKPWCQEMYFAGDNDRKNAIGKGEIAIAILYGGTGEGQSSGATDIKIGDAQYSIKAADGPGGPFALNGYFDMFHDDMVETFDSGTYPNLNQLLDKTEISADSIRLAIKDDVKNMGFTPSSPEHNQKCIEVMKLFIEVADKIVRKLPYPFVFCNPKGYRFVQSSGVSFDSVSQSKVRIKTVEASQNSLLADLQKNPRLWSIEKAEDVAAEIKSSTIIKNKQNAAETLRQSYPQSNVKEIIDTILKRGTSTTASDIPKTEEKSTKLDKKTLIRTMTKLFTGNETGLNQDEVIKSITSAMGTKNAEQYTVLKFVDDVAPKDSSESLRRRSTVPNQNFSLIEKMIRETLKSRYFNLK